MRRREVLGGLVVAAALAVACSGGGNNNNTDDSGGGAPAASAAAAPGGAKVGQAVKDGKFSFTVTKVDCSRSKIGSGDFAERAQGVYCLVSMTVKNVGKEAQLLDGSDQKAYDAKGAEYSADSSAAIYVNTGRQSTFLNTINPGNTVSGVVVFDVPKGTKLARLELHDSAFSDGVAVKL